LIALLGMMMSVALVAFARIESNLMFQALPNEDASMMIKQELAEFHMLLDRRVYGYGAVGDDELWGHLDKAHWLANAMVYGGIDNEWTYVPVDDERLKLKINGLNGTIAGLDGRANAALSCSPGSPEAEKADKLFETLLGETFREVEGVEDALHGSLVRLQRRHDGIITGILLLCGMFTIGTVTITYRYMSARKRVEDRLKDMHGFLQEVMDGVAEPIMVVDRGYKVVMMNTAAGKTSHGGESSMGGKCHELTHSRTEPCDSVGLPCPLTDVVASGRPVMVEHEHKHTDGTSCTMEILASPWRDGRGNIKGIIQSSRDISERKRIERERADFYAMVTHDIKSPLTAMLGYADLILSDKGAALDEHTRGLLAHIIKGGEKVLRLVGDFLAISQMETSRLSTNPFPCDIGKLLGEMGNELMKGFDDKGLKLEVNVADGMTKGLLMDQKLVRRAVENLLINAFNYTPPGGTVRLEAEQEDAGEGSFVSISVSDTGPGIPASEMERIFDRYYRSPKSKGVKGTGLGLAIVKAVAEAHGGNVTVQSEEGSGSTFVLRLPVGTKK